MGPRPSVRGPDAGYAGYPRPAGAAVGALATAWRGEPATTRSVIESFAAGASQEVKAELTRIPWMLRRFREPWDAADEATNEALDFLVHRAGGDWGHEAAHHAVDALESMAEDVPAVAQQVDALIGHILALCSPEPDAVIRPAADPMARQIEAMERESRRIRRNARRRDLAKTVGQSAAFDPERVLRSVLPLFTASAGDETYDRAVRTTMIGALEAAASPETVRDLLPVSFGVAGRGGPGRPECRRRPVGGVCECRRHPHTGHPKQDRSTVAQARGLSRLPAQPAHASGRQRHWLASGWRVAGLLLRYDVAVRAADPGAGVEQHGFFDAGEGGEQLADAQVESGSVGFAAHQVGHGDGGDAVGDAHADFLVGPVPHRGEGDDFGVFGLAESAFGVGLGAVAGDQLDDRPVVAVGDQQPFAEQLGFQALRAAVSTCQVSRSSAGFSGQLDAKNPTQPAGFADAGDGCFTPTRSRRVLARCRISAELGEFAGGFGDGLVEAG